MHPEPIGPAPERPAVPSLPPVTLANLAGGAAPELFNEELQRVWENVLDPNTTLKKRTVTLTVEISPTEDRDSAAVSVSVKSKLCPPRGAAAVVYVGRRHGVALATQYDPRQMQMAYDAESRPRVLPNPSAPAGSATAPKE